MTLHVFESALHTASVEYNNSRRKTRRRALFTNRIFIRNVRNNLGYLHLYFGAPCCGNTVRPSTFLAFILIIGILHFWQVHMRRSALIESFHLQ